MYFNMQKETDSDCIDIIEDLLGSSGTRKLAEKMFKLIGIHFSNFDEDSIPKENNFWALAAKAEKELTEEA